MLQTTRSYTGQYKHGLVVLVPNTKVTFPVYATVLPYTGQVTVYKVSRKLKGLMDISEKDTN